MATVIPENVECFTTEGKDSSTDFLMRMPDQTINTSFGIFQNLTGNNQISPKKPISIEMGF